MKTWEHYRIDDDDVNSDVYEFQMCDDRNTIVNVWWNGTEYGGSWSDCGNSGEFEIKADNLEDAKKEAEEWAKDNLPLK